MCNMQNFEPRNALIVKVDNFSKSQCIKNEIERDSMNGSSYTCTVSSLIIAQVCTRPSISFVVGYLGSVGRGPPTLRF